MFFDGSFFFFFFFFFKEFCKQLMSICLSDLKDQKKLTITDRKVFLPGGLTNGEGSLPVVITARIGQLGCLPMSKPDFCEIISKCDQRFLRRRIFLEFLHVCIVQKASIHQSHIYNQNFANNF